MSRSGVAVIKTKAVDFAAHVLRSRACDPSPASGGISIRQPQDRSEADWAADIDRWFDPNNYPGHCAGGQTDRNLIAVVDGVECVITISVPGAGSEADEICNRLAEAIVGRQT